MDDIMLLQKRPQNLWRIVLVLLLLFPIFMINFNEEYYGHREGGSLWIAAAIRTFNRYGIESVSFLPVRTAGPSNPETGEYYLHHPPLIVWFNAVGTWLFGYESDTGIPYESSIRMVGILFTLPTLALIYVLARRLTDAKSAFWAFLLYGVTPMTLYFSRAPYYDMIVLPFILAFTAVLISWLQRYTLWRSILLLVLAIVTMWVAWAGAFFLAALGLVVMIYGNREHRVWIVIIGVITALATAAIPVLYESLHAGALEDLREVFFFRSSNLEGSRNSSSFTIAGFLGLWLRDMLTVVSLALTAFGTWGIFALARKQIRMKEAILLVLIIAPLVFMLVFRNAFHFHDWYKIHFMPALAVGAGWAVYHGWQMRPVGRNRFVRPIIFAILICSMGITVYWTYLMHIATYNTFARTVAVELPLFTEETDSIASNINRPYSEIEYYAYRTVRWGVADEDMLRFYTESDSLDYYYLWCETNEGYEGLLADFSYELIADKCRLVHLIK